MGLNQTPSRVCMTGWDCLWSRAGGSNAASCTPVISLIPDCPFSKLSVTEKHDPFSPLQTALTLLAGFHQQGAMFVRPQVGLRSGWMSHFLRRRIHTCTHKTANNTRTVKWSCTLPDMPLILLCLHIPALHVNIVHPVSISPSSHSWWFSGKVKNWLFVCVWKRPCNQVHSQKLW